MEKEEKLKISLRKILDFLLVTYYEGQRCSFCGNKASHHLSKATVFPAGRIRYYLITPKKDLFFCDECYEEFRNLNPLTNIKGFRKSKFAEDFTFEPVKLKEKAERLLIRIWTQLFDEKSIDYAMLLSWKIANALCYVPRRARNLVAKLVVFVESSNIFCPGYYDSLFGRSRDYEVDSIICLTPQEEITTILRFIAHVVLQYGNTLNINEEREAALLSEKWLKTGVKF